MSNESEEVKAGDAVAAPVDGVVMREVDQNDCDLMTLDCFKAAVKAGAYIDYDGYGYYATETEQSDIALLPSQIGKQVAPAFATHIAWYNR